MTTQTNIKISRSRAGHVWATVSSVSMPDIVRRELFNDVMQARAAAKVLAVEVAVAVTQEQTRLDNAAAPRV